MIVEGFLDIVFVLVYGFLDLLPNVTWDVNTGAFGAFIHILSVVGYFLPMDAVAVVVSMVIGIMMFRIGVSIIKTLWQLIPFM